MSRRTVARVLWVAAAVAMYGGLSLAAGRANRRSASPFRAMPVTGTLVFAFGVLVLAPAAWVVSHWPRIAVRLGIAPVDPSGGGPDEQLGSAEPGDQRP